MFRGGAGLILAHILYWFLPSCTDFFLSCLEEGLKHSESPAACAFSHSAEEREEKSTGQGSAQKVSPFTTLHICHLFQPHNNRIFSFLGFHSHTIFKMFCSYPKSKDAPLEANLSCSGRQSWEPSSLLAAFCLWPAHTTPLGLFLTCKWGVQPLPALCEALGDQQMEHLI